EALRACMPPRLLLLLLLPAAALALSPAPAHSQVPAPAHPEAPFVPTPPDVVHRMLTLAKTGPNDYVIDLGSGDGRIVREAARSFGARGFGVEHDPELVARSQELARREGVSDKVAFMAQDLFQTDLSDATVVTMYLFPAINLKLRPRLLAQLKPGTRVVSHDFDMADWAPDATAKLYSKEKYGATGGESTIYLWFVPADVAGRWTWRLEIGGQPIDYELTAAQRFQKIDATLRVGGQVRPVQDVRLQGDRISFTVVGEIKGSTVRQEFSGRASGDGIHGSVILSGPRMQGAADWAAQRSERTSRPAGALAPTSRITGALAPAARITGAAPDARYVSANEAGRALAQPAGGAR
ncbi:MAG: SAM-dependent methyltransferase, partial [Burkholderiales bacterium]